MAYIVKKLCGAFTSYVDEIYAAFQEHMEKQRIFYQRKFSLDEESSDHYIHMAVHYAENEDVHLYIRTSQQRNSAEEPDFVENYDDFEVDDDDDEDEEAAHIFNRCIKFAIF